MLARKQTALGLLAYLLIGLYTFGHYHSRVAKPDGHDVAVAVIASGFWPFYWSAEWQKHPNEWNKEK